VYIVVLISSFNLFTLHGNFGCGYLSASSYKIEFTHDGMSQMWESGIVEMLNLKGEVVSCWEIT
jgi:hypothetical protein